MSKSKGNIAIDHRSARQVSRVNDQTQVLASCTTYQLALLISVERELVITVRHHPSLEALLILK